MKRSRRVLLTMMGTAAAGAVSTGFVRRLDCGPGGFSDPVRGADGRLVEVCRVPGVIYGGFGTGPRRFHFHGGGG